MRASCSEPFMTSASNDLGLILDKLPADRDLPFPHVLRVDASAGSGKTFCLAQRFIQFILSGKIPRNSLENLLAITFTNEAAREMGSRVLNQLKLAALGDAKVLEQLSGLLAGDSRESVQTRALMAIDEILANFDLFQVRTIDSFIRRLVMSAPQELGISPLQDIDQNSDRFLREAFDRLLVLSEKDRDIFRVLKDALDHSIHFENRLSWWPVDGMLARLKSFFETEGTYGGISFDIDDINRARRLAGELAARARDFLESAQSEGLQMKAKAIVALESAAGGDLARSLGTSWWKKEDLVALLLKGSPSPSGEMKKFWIGLRKLAFRYCEARAYQGPGAYLRLYSLWSEQLKVLKDRAMVLFFQDFNLMSRRLLEDFGVPEVMFRLGERLSHFLIDEFQDTSDLQWKNLLPLVTEAVSRGGSLFYVGDVKQMLYGWRGSDRQLFFTVPGSLSSVAPEARINVVLPYNWRSCRRILDFTGSVFHERSLRRVLREYDSHVSDDEIGDVLKTFAHVSQRVPPERSGRHEGMVYVELLKGLKNAADIRAAAAAWTVDKVLRVLDRRSPGDVTVLVRRNGDVERITAALSSAGIPASSHRQLDIRYDPVVRELINFIGFLEDPGDSASLCSVITGKILEESWHKYSPGISSIKWVENHLVSQGDGACAGLLQALRQELPGFFRDCFEGPLRAVGYLPPYDLLCGLIRNTNLQRRFPESIGALEHLLGLFHESGPMGGIGWGDMGRLDEEPPELFMAGGSGGINAVRIMTIHKAKGLESPVVLVPMAALVTDRLGPVLQREEEGMRIIDLSGPCRKISAGLNSLYRQEKLRAITDELNVLYVALTRAMEELYVLVPEKGGNSKNLFPHMLEDVMGDSDLAVLGEVPDASSEASGNGQDRCQGAFSARASSGLASGGAWYRWRWPVNLVRKERDIETLFSPDRRNAMRVGERIHRILALLDRPLECPCDPSAVRKLIEGLLPEQLRGGRNMEIPRIAAAICHRRLSPFFWAKDGDEIWVEKDLADSRGGLHRLDRAVVSGSSITVLEFKSGMRRSASDPPQLQGYLDILSGIYPGKKVNGFLVYLERGEIIGREGMVWTF